MSPLYPQKPGALAFGVVSAVMLAIPMLGVAVLMERIERGRAR